MAVSTKNSSDQAGKIIDAEIAAQQTVVNGLSASGASHALYKLAAEKLDQLQRQAVAYYLANGRINAATVLSTLS